MYIPVGLFHVATNQDTYYYVYMIVLHLWSPCAVGLTMHATILSFMFAIIEEDGKITVSLSGQGIAEGSITEQNKSFVQSHLAVLLKQAFPHLEE